MAKFTNFNSPASIRQTQPWKFINTTNNYEAKVSEKLALITAVSITLPSNPSDGSTIIVSDYKQGWTANNVSVNSTETIDDQTAPFILDEDLKYGFVSFIYDKANLNWGLIINFLGYQTVVEASSTEITADNNQLTADNNKPTTS